MSTLTFEDIVSQLVSIGYDRALAELEVRRQHPHLTPLVSAPAKDESVLEKQEQWACMKVYRAFGCAVYSTSQSRAAKVSPGLPDLLVFAPRVHAFWYHEVKRQVGGVQSSAQKDFQEYCADCGIPYVLGDRTMAEGQLIAIGVAIRVDDRIEPAAAYHPRGSG